MKLCNYAIGQHTRCHIWLECIRGAAAGEVCVAMRPVRGTVTTAKRVHQGQGERGTGLPR